MAAPPSPRRTREDGLRRIRALVASPWARRVLLGVVGSFLALRAYESAKDDDVARLENSAAVTAGDYSASSCSGRQLRAPGDRHQRHHRRGRRRRHPAPARPDRPGHASPPVRLRDHLVRRRRGRQAPSARGSPAGAGPTASSAPARRRRRRRAAAGERQHRAVALPASRSSRSWSRPTGRGRARQRRPRRRRLRRPSSTSARASGGTFRGGNVFILDRTGRLFVAPGLTESQAARRRPGDPAHPHRADAPRRGGRRRQPHRGAEPARAGRPRPRLRHRGRDLRVDVHHRRLRVVAVRRRPRDPRYRARRARRCSSPSGSPAPSCWAAASPGQYSDAPLAEDRIRRLQRITAGVSAASTQADVARVVLERGPGLHRRRRRLHRAPRRGRTTLTTLHLAGLQRAGEPGVPELPRHRRPARRPRASGRARSGSTTATEVRARYPHLREFHGAMSHEAVAALPLVVEGEPIGGLALSFPGARRFDEEERAFLISVADLSAQALDRARLYELEQRKTERQQMLAETGVMLDAPLGARATLTALANLCVPRLARLVQRQHPDRRGHRGRRRRALRPGARSRWRRSSSAASRPGPTTPPASAPCCAPGGPSSSRRSPRRCWSSSCRPASAATRSPPSGSSAA